MRILLVSDHQYPASGNHGVGRSTRAFPSGSGQHIHDLLAQGLARLEHEVFYLLKGGEAKPLPANITAISDTVPSVDIVHGIDPFLVAAELIHSGPFVVSRHAGKSPQFRQRASSVHNWIFVSRTQAAAYGSNRFVYNGIDPAAYIYSEKKEDYYLFMAGMNNYKDKGLERALALCQELQADLVVAGTSTSERIIRDVARLCNHYSAEYVGDVRGEEKAKLLAHAKALIFPTEWDECCPLTIPESLISGTPVIVSNNTACSEMMSSEVGFVCNDEKDYVHAVNNIHSISPHECRNYSIKKYHYMRMVEDYIGEYKKEIESWSDG